MDHFPNQFSETSLNRFDAPDQSLQLDVLAKTEGVAVILEINEENISWKKSLNKIGPITHVFATNVIFPHSEANGWNLFQFEKVDLVGDKSLQHNNTICWELTRHVFR